MGNAEKKACFDTWVALNGDDPAAEIEPTVEQLTTLSDTIDDEEPPYADFAVWGNRSYRNQRKSRLRGLRPASDGTWLPGEIPGPPDIITWLSCFMVFRTAAIMIKCLTASILDEYRDRIHRWANMYGPKCWHIIYAADQKAREDQWERSMRKVERKVRARQYVEYFDTAPWIAALRHLLDDQTFWNDNLIHPCILVAARAEAHTRVDFIPDSGGDVAAYVPETVIQPSGVRGADLAQKGQDGHYTHNRKGVELCIGFGKATCMKKDKLNKCASNSSRTHQCAICLQVHPTCEHDKHANAAKKGGKGAGRQRNPKAWWKQ